MIGAIESDQADVNPQEQYAQQAEQHANVETIDFVDAQEVVNEDTGEVSPELFPDKPKF